MCGASAHAGRGSGLGSLALTRTVWGVVEALETCVAAKLCRARGGSLEWAAGEHMRDPMTLEGDACPPPHLEPIAQQLQPRRRVGGGAVALRMRAHERV